MNNFARGLIAVLMCLVFAQHGYAETAAPSSANCDPALCQAAGITVPALVKITPIIGEGIQLCSCNFNSSYCDGTEDTTAIAPLSCVPTSGTFSTSPLKVVCVPVVIGGTVRMVCRP